MIIHIPNTFLSFEFFWGLLCKDYKIDQAEQPLGTAIGLHGLEKWLPYFRYFVHRLTIIPVTIVLHLTIIIMIKLLKSKEY